ncbi:HAMP domain-containing sensor histidine kinase [Bdellovibrionota bacterium FG-1]
MNLRGGLARASQWRLRMMVAAQVLWLAVVLLLGAWWGRLVLQQAARIADLENAAGLPYAVAQEHLFRTHRMLFWESGTYVVLLLAITALLFWIYWRDALRSRGVHAFFASMTHELRTPLTSIRLQAESIAENLSADVTQKQLVERLLQDTMRLEGQVERTLELARVEGGGPVFPAPMELKPWLERLVSNWKEAYGERVHFETSFEDISAEADATALQVVMKNLLENSIRHSKKAELSVRLTARSQEGQICITFRDNGAGFHGETRKLGKIFQKGAGSHGAGVGLYLMKVLVGQMGGRVVFNPDPGFETTVWLKAAPNG